MGKFIDLTRQRFGRLIVIKRVENNKWNSTCWECQCDCTNITIVDSGKIKSGHTKSCGCLNIEKTKKRLTKHGYCKNELYNTWCGIINRCYNKNHISYKNYGARGIAVCDKWRRDFIMFYN